MKKICIIFALVLVLAGCSAPKTQITVHNNSDSAVSGVWISYSELNQMLTSENDFKNEFQNVLSNLKQFKIENLYIHVRAFGDSLYNSEYFPLMQTVSGYEYDVFEYVINACKQENIKVHAWINPYRISTSSEDINTLNPQSPAYKWLTDEKAENDKNVCFSNGIYFNPAEQEVITLVINGVKEIINKYDVDGIHFDDYFYPTTDAKFDEISYNSYFQGKSNPLCLEDWRRNNVNILISGCYNAIKYINKDVVFSVSPMASIERNYNNLYADVLEWINGGYIDYIIPQIYFGFEYPDENFRFVNLLNDWKKAVKQSKVGLFIGLATYKAVPELQEDKAEWENNHDIISRQVKTCVEDEVVSGYVYFSYSSLFSMEQPFKEQRENIEKLGKANG